MSLPILPGRPRLAVRAPRRRAAARVDPASAGLEAAEAAGAWEAYRDAVASLTPEARHRARQRVRPARPRRRRLPHRRASGGTAPASRSRQRYVVANGFEADPGAQVDRTLMERDPHAVVEGVALAACAVRAEVGHHRRARLGDDGGRPPARGHRARRRRAATSAPEATETGRPLRIEVRELSGSFVVGEETVLLRALEGRRAQPDQRPPYPSQQGLWGKPTVVNNVKTLAAVPWIVRHGAGAFASLGDAEAPGTTLVQLGGAVRKPGIVEVPLGATIREVLDGPGGFVQGTLKAVLVGGPTGGFLPPDALDTPLTYGALAEAGALAGSGTLLALDAVDLPRRPGHAHDPLPQRRGLRQDHPLPHRHAPPGRARRRLLQRPRRGPRDAALLGDLAADIRDAALCGLEAERPEPAPLGDAILRRGVRGAHRAWPLPRRRLPAHLARGRGPMIEVASSPHRGGTQRSLPDAMTDTLPQIAASRAVDDGRRAPAHRRRRRSGPWSRRRSASRSTAAR